MMRKTVVSWIFIAACFSFSNAYVGTMYTNTDNGYCEYHNGLLIPVNDYAFDTERCETIYCEPGKIIIRGCYPVMFRPPHANLSCTLVRGEDIFQCCPTIPKCKVIGRLPENYSFPRHWIVEDYGNSTLVPPNANTSVKGLHEEDSTGENDYKKDFPEEDKFGNDYEEDLAEEDKFEKDYEENSAEEDKFEIEYEGHSAKEDKFEIDFNKDSAEEDKFEIEYEGHSAKEDKFEIDFNKDSAEEDKFEIDQKEDSAEENNFKKITSEKGEFAKYVAEKVATTKEDETEITQDPLLSEINRYARNYPMT